MKATLAIVFFGKVLGPDDLSDDSNKVSSLKFNQHSITFWNQGDAKPPTHVLFFDFLPKRDRETLKRFASSKKALARAEPRVVNPHQYATKVEKMFDLVFDSKVVVENGESKFGLWQVGYVPGNFKTQLQKTAQNTQDRARRVGLINENKFSLVRGELYGLRAKVIMDSSFWEEPLQVAGKNWTRGLVWTLARQLSALFDVLKAGSSPDVSRLRLPIGSSSAHFLGRVESEIDFLRSLEIAIVIENEATYVSEKLTNALIAGCRIVYVGPPIEHDHCCSAFIYASQPTSDAVGFAVHKILNDPKPSRDAFLEHLQTCKFLESWLISERMAALAGHVEKWVL